MHKFRRLTSLKSNVAILREENPTIKCIKGIKIGDSLLRDEEGNLITIHPDLFYERGLEGFWMLKKIGMSWKIIRFLASVK